MYGAYTEINQLMVRDGHVSISAIEEIPAILPNTGLNVCDIRCEKTWKAEQEDYLAQKKEYTGETFGYSRLWSCIERSTTQFVEELSK